MIRSAIRGYSDHLEQLRQLAMVQAWHAGVIAKGKKTPSLRQLIDLEPKAKTGGDLAGSLALWAAATTHLGKPH